MGTSSSLDVSKEGDQSSQHVRLKHQEAEYRVKELSEKSSEAMESWRVPALRFFDRKVAVQPGQ
jgi:hypothetical protein